MKTESLLAERGKTHGDYRVHASISQNLKACMQNARKVGVAPDTPIKCYDLLDETQRESLDMIAHKIGRILAGDPDLRDHWDDIAGYAKLVADRCSK